MPLLHERSAAAGLTRVLSTNAIRRDHSQFATVLPADEQSRPAAQMEGVRESSAPRLPCTMCQDACAARFVVAVITDAGCGGRQRTWFEDLIELTEDSMLSFRIPPVDVGLCQAQDVDLRAESSDGHRLNMTKFRCRFQAVDVLKIYSHMMFLFRNTWVAPGFIR